LYVALDKLIQVLSESTRTSLWDASQRRKDAHWYSERFAVEER